MGLADPINIELKRSTIIGHNHLMRLFVREHRWHEQFGNMPRALTSDRCSQIKRQMILLLAKGKVPLCAGTRNRNDRPLLFRISTYGCGYKRKLPSACDSLGQWCHRSLRF